MPPPSHHTCIGSLQYRSHVNPTQLTTNELPAAPAPGLNEMDGCC